MKRLMLLLLLLIPALANATVSVTANRVQYNCNGSTTSYAYTSKIYEDSELTVTKVLAGAETTLVLNTDYTVTGAGTSGGNVVLTAGSKCASGYTLTITRDIELTQETDYEDGGGLSAETLETNVDRLTLITQDLGEKVDRSFKTTQSANGPAPLLDAADERAGKYLYFDTNGDLTAEGSAPTVVEGEAVNDLSALKALTTTPDAVYILYRATKGDGGHGWFRWDSSDLSAEVASDTQNGIYVPPNSDTTGASGAWVRQYTGNANIAWFGATTASADNTTAIEGLLGWLPEGGGMVVPEGSFKAQGLVIDNQDLTIECLGKLIPVDETDATPVITFGSSTTTATRLRGNLRLDNPSYNDGSTLAVGALIRGMVESNFEFSSVEGFLEGIQILPNRAASTGGVFAYNIITLGDIADNKISLHIAPVNATNGYANESLFIGGRLNHAGVSGSYNILIEDTGSNKPNALTFLKPTFEGGFGYAKVNGSRCKILDARFETNDESGADIFEITSGSNEVTVDSSTGMDLSTASSDLITDVGVGTRVTNTSFTIASDVTDYVTNGTPMVAVIGGVRYQLIAKSAVYSAPNTTIVLYTPLFPVPTAITIFQYLIRHGLSKPGLLSK